MAKQTSCQEYCREHGAFCEGSWDDRDGACERAGSKQPSCFTVRSSQICACRRSCVDDGPWECLEEGCPARSVTCEMLASACFATFGNIWRKPPHGTASLLVQQACPASCQMCNASSDGSGAS